MDQYSSFTALLQVATYSISYKYLLWCLFSVKILILITSRISLQTLDESHAGIWNHSADKTTVQTKAPLFLFLWFLVYCISLAQVSELQHLTYCMQDWIPVDPIPGSFPCSFRKLVRQTVWTYKKKYIGIYKTRFYRDSHSCLGQFQCQAYSLPDRESICHRN